MNTKFKNIVDLTHAVNPKIPTFDGGCGFHLAVSLDYHECTSPNFFRVQKIDTRAGIGTHIDAPSHCIPGAKTVEALDLHDLIADCIVINVEKEADEKYIIQPSSVDQFEKEHGTIAPGTFVIFYTGWDRFWDTPEKYLNEHKSPSLHVSTAEMLISRGVSGIGIDTLSADKGDEDFPVHRAVLGAGKYLVENIANAKNLPPVGAKTFVLPMKIQDATEAPVRIIALFD